MTLILTTGDIIHEFECITEREKMCFSRIKVLDEELKRVYTEIGARFNLVPKKNINNHITELDIGKQLMYSLDEELITKAKEIKRDLVANIKDLKKDIEFRRSQEESRRYEIEERNKLADKILDHMDFIDYHMQITSKYTINSGDIKNEPIIAGCNELYWYEFDKSMKCIVNAHERYTRYLNIDSWNDKKFFLFKGKIYKIVIAPFNKLDSNFSISINDGSESFAKDLVDDNSYVVDLVTILKGDPYNDYK